MKLTIKQNQFNFLLFSNKEFESIFSIIENIKKINKNIVVNVDMSRLKTI